MNRRCLLVNVRGCDREFTKVVAVVRANRVIRKADMGDYKNKTKQKRALLSAKSKGISFHEVASPFPCDRNLAKL